MRDNQFLFSIVNVKSRPFLSFEEKNTLFFNVSQSSKIFGYNKFLNLLKTIFFIIAYNFSEVCVLCKQYANNL